MSLYFVIIKKGEIVDANNVLKTLFISFDYFTFWGWQNVNSRYVKINVNKFLIGRSRFYANHSWTKLQLELVIKEVNSCFENSHFKWDKTFFSKIHMTNYFWNIKKCFNGKISLKITTAIFPPKISSNLPQISFHQKRQNLERPSLPRLHGTVKFNGAVGHLVEPSVPFWIVTFRFSLPINTHLFHSFRHPSHTEKSLSKILSHLSLLRVI